MDHEVGVVRQDAGVHLEAAGVRFLGDRRDMPRLYAGMDMLVLASHHRHGAVGLRHHLGADAAQEAPQPSQSFAPSTGAQTGGDNQNAPPH